MTKYSVKSLVYHPTIANTDELELSNRGIFPSSLFDIMGDKLLEHNGPMTFMVKTENSILPVYVVAHEFSAMDDTIYLPKIIMNKSFIEEDDKASIELIELPKITKLALKPIGQKFAREVEDPKGLLERNIVNNYQILQLGDSIYVNEYELVISKMEPSDVVSTFNTDPEVDFLPCREDELEELERQKKIQKLKKEQ